MNLCLLQRSALRGTHPVMAENNTMTINGPKALVITAAGINCDLELAQSFAAAGAVPESVLLSDLVRNPSRIDRYKLIGLPVASVSAMTLLLGALWALSCVAASILRSPQP